MPFRITATLKGGRVLEVELPDDETVTMELRFIERLRRARWGLPAISWRTVDGQRWCFRATEILGELEVSEVQPAAAAS